MKGVLVFFAFVGLFICGQHCWAQYKPSRISIVVSPALFVPVSVAAQGGIQYRASSKFSVLVEGALPTFSPDNTEYEKIDYWRAGAELKYLTGSDSTSSKYVSVQCTYLFRRLQDDESGVYYTKSQTFTYNNAVIQSPVISTAIKMGIEINSKKRFFADIFIGAGARFVFTKYATKNALVTSIETPKPNIFKFDDAWKYNYTLIRPHATAGVRFGLRL